MCTRGEFYNGDLDTIEPGFYNLRAGDGNVQHAPTQTPCFLFVSPYSVERGGFGYYKFQLAVTGDGAGEIYYRIYTSSWQGWKHITP